MRPLSVVLLLLDMEMLFVESMGLSFWIGFVWSIFAAILYIIHVYTLPTARFPRLQHSGEVRIDGSAHIAVEGMICGAVRIVSFRTLDLRTLHLKLSTKTHRAVHQAAFPISFPPGSHVSLKVGDIVREFTPINSDVKHGEIEIVVRLVPGGPFSNLISSSLDLNSSEVSNSEWNECYLDCSIYGPLLPLPSKFGYRPYFSAGECGNDDPLRPTLIMIGAGSGAMPFLSVIEAALKNKEDKTLLKLLSLSGASKQSDSDKKTDFGTFMQDKINQLQLPTKAGTGTDPVHGRFVGVNQRERFALSMLDSWIQDPLKSKRTDASAVLAAATDRMIVWVCGPPGFGEQCRSALVKGKGFHREQIFVLGADDR